MRRRHRAGVQAAALLLGVIMASDSVAAHGGGRSGGHTARGSSGHFGGGFAGSVRYVPRTVFIATPVGYFPSAYYTPPPVYYYPPSYYQPAQPPVQSSFPPGTSIPPPPAGGQSPLSNYEPAQNPIYVCKDSSGRTTLTNRKEDTVGMNCSERPVQNAKPPVSTYSSPPRSGSAPASPRGPYVAQDAFRYRFYCPDTRKYYPEVNECTPAWLKVVPDGLAARR
jgi:hypothetical protein